MKGLIFSMMLVIICRPFEITEKSEAVSHPPETHFGNPAIACNPGSTGTTGGFGTYFSDNSYACQKWNGKAKSLPDCFVALNGICGMDTKKFCDHCVEVINTSGGTEKCRVIDFCDPSNCDFYDAGHLDFLNNNANSHYKFVDKGVYVYPYNPKDGQPKISWKWTTC